MIISHNLIAMNSNRQLGLVTGAKRKSTERLSSGYKINRAADDAAGLAISEKMRRQVRGLTQASLNAQDGISLVQVADGAMNEIHDIMQRMNELAVKASNDTNNSDDRSYIQAEMNQLRNEIGRITSDTSFNEIYIFNGPRLVEISGDYDNARFDETVTVGGTNMSPGKVMDFSNISGERVQELVGKSFDVHCSAGCGQIFHFEFNNGEGSSATASGDATRPNLIVKVDVSDLENGVEIAQKIYELARDLNPPLPLREGTNPSPGIYIGHTNGLAVDDGKLLLYAVQGGGSGYIEASDLEEGSWTLNLQVGAEAWQLLPVKLFNLSPSILGVGSVDVSTQRGAEAAIGAIKGGINKLSSYRSYYGAIQNRLEHTIKNLDNVVENTAAAESQIRDTDMATEMVKFSNTNILEQAGVSVLTQANQIPETVLSLLR